MRLHSTTSPDKPNLGALPASPRRRRLLNLALGLAAALAAGPAANARQIRSWGESNRARRLARELAVSTGLPLGWIEHQLAQARYRAVVARLIVPTAPGKRDWHAYRQRLLQADRIAAGAAFIHANAPLLDRGEANYGVPAAVVVGLLGVETYWGRDMGRLRVLDALSTLALDFPRAAPKDRSAYFAAQLGEFLLWCRATHIDPTSVHGSYAGAIGMPQFMPGAIRQWGTSFDGGAVDLVGKAGDAIASVGNFLQQHGWQRGMPTHFEVAGVAAIDPARLATLLAPDIVPSFSPAQLQAAGLQLDATAAAYPDKLALVELPNAGQASDYVLGTANFFALTRYNRSAFYALAVLELGAAATQAASATAVSAGATGLQRDVDAGKNQHGA